MGGISCYQQTTDLTTRLHRNCPDHVDVAAEGDATYGWEWLEVFGAGQLRHQVLGLDSQPHLPLARRQIQVQTSLEPLSDEVGPSRNFPEAGVLLGDEGQLALVSLPGGAFPLLLLLVCEQVLGRRVVALLVPRQEHLRGWDGVVDPPQGRIVHLNGQYCGG